LCPFRAASVDWTRTVMLTRGRLYPGIVFILAAVATADTARADGYDEVARPFIERHCLACHGEKKPLAGESNQDN
jgi:mono/diheme cytochrome c family protein